jgi:DDE superfamily endonuclease
MEDVLEVYQRPYDPAHPLVCLDEKGKELQAHVAGREPLPAKAGEQGADCVRQDHEYRRAGSANLLLFSEPLRGWRKVVVSQERDAVSFAHHLRRLVDEDYPQADKVILVSDNLNIHGAWSLYDAFPAQEALRIAQKLEWHYTPEHGSWLNMAEIELSALARQCLNQRFENVDTLRSAVEAWMTARNHAQITIHWQFTSADARIRLRRLYPVIKDNI